MRVLFVSRRFFPAISGMSVYALNLLRELVAAGHDVTMVSQFRGDAAGTRVYGGGPPPEVPGVRVIGLEAHGEQAGGAFERDVEAMVEVALREHAAAPFDVLHAQYGYPTGLAVLEASRRTGVPNVVSVQGGDGHWVGSCCDLHLEAMRVVCAHAGRLLIGSASFRDEVVERIGADPARFTLVPGAVDTTRFTPGANAGGLLYHGRVDRRKGVLDLLEALRSMDDPPPTTISGIGPDLDAARQAAGGLPVTFLGHIPYEDVPPLYREHAVFVSPTYAEGFSNTILEAMAGGCAVVSTRSVGVVDCLRDGDNGVLVAPGDVPALAEALQRVTTDDALRARLRATALAEVRATYAWPVVGRLVQQAYAEAPPPSTAWSLPGGPPPPCRFRDAPHLL